jgi:hypothetical protein
MKILQPFTSLFTYLDYFRKIKRIKGDFLQAVEEWKRIGGFTASTGKLLNFLNNYSLVLVEYATWTPTDLDDIALAMVRYVLVEHRDTLEVMIDRIRTGRTMTVSEMTAMIEVVSASTDSKDDPMYAYDWNINWGDGTAAERKTGTGASTSARIAHTYSAAGQYQITITPAGSTTGWFKAFGFSDNTSGANVQTNKNKVVSPDTSITVGMFAVPGATNVGNDVCQSWFDSCKGKNLRLRADFRFAADWNILETV